MNMKEFYDRVSNLDTDKDMVLGWTVIRPKIMARIKPTIGKEITARIYGYDNEMSNNRFLASGDYDDWLHEGSTRIRAFMIERIVSMYAWCPMESET